MALRSRMEVTIFGTRLNCIRSGVLVNGRGPGKGVSEPRWRGGRGKKVLIRGVDKHAAALGVVPDGVRPPNFHM